MLLLKRISFWPASLWLLAVLLLALGGLFFNPSLLAWGGAGFLLLAVFGEERLIFFNLILALLLGQLYRFTFFGFSLAPVDLAVGGSALFLGIKFWRKSSWGEFLKNPLWWPTLFLLVWFFLSWLFSLRLFSPAEALFGLLYYGRFLLYAWLLLALTQERQNLQGYLLLFLWGMVILGLGQFFFFSDLRLLERAGWDPHQNRLVGSFLDPNLWAGGLVLALGFLFSQKKFFGLKLATLLSLFLTFSRSGWLAFLAWGLFWAAGRKKIVLLLLPLLFLAAVILVPPARERLSGIFQGDSSFQARLINWREGFRLSFKEPLWGIGFNNLKAWRNQEGDSLRGERSAGTLDNSFLLVAATAGFPGLLFYLWFCLTLIRFAFRQRALALSMIALGLQSLFVNSLFYSPTLLLLILLLANAKNDSA